MTRALSHGRRDGGIALAVAFPKEDCLRDAESTLPYGNAYGARPLALETARTKPYHTMEPCRRPEYRIG